MKALMASLTFLLVSVVCTASITDFNLLGKGRFAGKPAAYVSGDTIVYVLRSETTTALGEVKYYYSYNGGTSWDWSSVLPTDSQEYLPGAPTLCYTPEEQMVVTQKYLSKSTNGGSTWQNPPYICNKSFDNSPILEKSNGAYRYIHVNMPYPEDRQDEFTIPGSDEFSIPQTFMNISASPNDENVYYKGWDVINGPVRINDDLQIKQAGGDPSNPDYNYGWPTFNGPVVVAGEVHGTPENYNVDQVFPGGLIEQAPTLELPDTFNIYQNGRIIGSMIDEQNRIYYIEFHGSTISG